MATARHCARAAALLAAAALALAAGCSAGGDGVAALWTDRPEVAFYAKYFNAVQDRHRVEVFHHEFPALMLERLAEGGEGAAPDIVVASWLAGSSAQAFFRPLDGLLSGEGRIEGFYESLLEKGRSGGRQRLLPVSFNAPLAAFSRAGAAGSPGPPALSGPLVVSLEEMRELGGNFNARSAGALVRVGFSPTWGGDFPLVAAALLGTSFGEGSPLDWDAEALDRASAFLRGWVAETNSGAQAVDSFDFRFFNIPPAGMLESGRILFAHMSSAEFFTLPEDRRAALGFRWLAEGDAIPLRGGAAFLGLTQARGAFGRGGAQGRAAAASAEAFARWLFSADTQRRLLERSHKFRQMEASFGIAGGFSALRPVTEQVFPQFYPDLLGLIPPEDFLAPARALPPDWPAIRERAALPYLHERARQQPGEEIAPLEARAAEWARLNRL